MTPPEPIRVLIADDHFIVREGLRMILETDEGMEVCAEAADGEEMIEQVRLTAPAVVLLDVRMPKMDGLAALTLLRRERKDVAVIVLTTFDEEGLLARSIRAEVSGYLLKDVSRETLLAAIRKAARGELLFQPDQLRRVLDQPVTSPMLLSVREIEVLGRVAQGERSKEIAAALNITERTVKAHLESVFLKLRVDSRAAAVAIAAQRGWIGNGQRLL